MKKSDGELTIQAKNVEEAISIGLKEFSTTAEFIEYEVIERTRKSATIKMRMREPIKTLNLQQSKLRHCPDCGKEILRRSTTCPHCGCPIERTVCCPYCGYDTDKTHKEIQALGCKVPCKNCDKDVRVTSPEDELRYKIAQEASKSRCPKCGSTAITTSPRGANFVLGFIGASKTVNRCANCGHIWKP